MSQQETVHRKFGSVEENALRIPEDKAEQIIDALNADLADTYVLYHQLKKHHWNVAGAEFLDLHEFLGDAAYHAEEGADELAERLQALGGTPAAGFDQLGDAKTVEAEGEDVYTVRASLENDLELYGDIIESLRDHVELAQNLGDHATAEILREILVEVEDDAHHVEHYLENDTLVAETAQQ